MICHNISNKCAIIAESFNILFAKKRISMTTDDLDLSQITEKSAQAANLLKLLSNQHRLLILCHLVEGELCVSDLEERLEISQSSLSQHLARLREQGIVDFRKESTTVYYRLADPKAAKVLETLYELYCKS